MPLFVNADDFNNSVAAIKKWSGNLSYSLPRFTKPSLIESPMFIDASLVDEDVLNDVVKSLYNIYIGYIMTALQMNQYVTGNRTLRDLNSIVSTDSYLSTANEGLYISNELLISDFGKKKEKKNKINYAHEANESKIIDEVKNVAISGGRIVEVNITNPEDTKQSFKIPLFVKFNPRFISSNIMSYVVSANFESPFMRRLMQLRAGEIKFFKDFLFQLDQIKEREKALKDDKGHALSDIFRNQRKSFTRALFKLISFNASQNIFNSVFIFEKDQFMQDAHNAGLNFKDYNKRQAFMNSTTALFVILVDTKYSLVEMYTHSIPSYGEYTYRSIKTIGNGDKMGIAEIMDVLQKNQLPKF